MKHTIVDHVQMFFGQRKHTRLRKRGQLVTEANPYYEGMTRTFYDNFVGEQKPHWLTGGSGGQLYHPVKDSHYTPMNRNGGFFAIYDPQTFVDNEGNTYSFDIAVSKVNTAKSFLQKYGRIEFRTTMPVDNATWAAWWLHGPDWLPEMGFEEVEGQHGLVKCYMIWRESDEIKRTKRVIRVEEDDEALYHLFAINWEPDRITMEVDNIKVFVMSRKSIVQKFQEELFLIINTDIKADLIPHDDLQHYFSAFFMDYVRVFQKSSRLT